MCTLFYGGIDNPLIHRIYCTSLVVNDSDAIDVDRDSIRRYTNQTLFYASPVFVFNIIVTEKHCSSSPFQSIRLISLPATATAMAGGAPAPVFQLFRSNITRVRDPTSSRVCVYSRQWIRPILHAQTNTHTQIRPRKSDKKLH